MAIVAIDYGRRRIGLAITDAEETGAYPLGTVQRRSTARDVEEIAGRIADRGVGRIVVGLPLNMDGSEGPSARSARAFADRLGAHLKLPVDFQDERLTSFEAEDRLAAAASERRKRAVVDTVAATIILESWLAERGSSR